MAAGHLDKVKPGEACKRKTTQWSDPDFSRVYPTLHLYLTQSSYPDGSLRVLSTLTVFCDQGALTLVLNDRENNRSVFLNAPTFCDSLLALEDALQTGSADWRIRGGGSSLKGSTPF